MRQSRQNEGREAGGARRHHETARRLSVFVFPTSPLTQGLRGRRDNPAEDGDIEKCADNPQADTAGAAMTPLVPAFEGHSDRQDSNHSCCSSISPPRPDPQPRFAGLGHWIRDPAWRYYCIRGLEKLQFFEVNLRKKQFRKEIAWNH
jgi:hypothetical protein